MKLTDKKNFDLLVIGEALVEFSCEDDLIPCETFKKDIGGADIVVAAAAARLGSRVQLLTSIAADPFEDFMRGRLMSHGINIDHVHESPGYNGLYMTSSRCPESREYLVHHPGTASRHVLPGLVDDGLIEKSKIVYASSELQSVSRQTRLAIFKAFHYANSNGVMVAYDPNVRLQRWSLDDAKENLWNVLSLVDLIFISAPEEAQALLGCKNPHEIVGFLWDRGVSTVVVKMGAGGCMVGYKNRGEHGDLRIVEQEDAGGAFKCPTLVGSAFNGAFLHGIARGMTPFAAAGLANSVALYKGITGDGLDSLPTSKNIS